MEKLEIKKEDRYVNTTKNERIYRLRARLLLMGANLSGRETYEELRDIMKIVRNNSSNIKEHKFLCKKTLEVELKKRNIKFSKNATYEDLNEIYQHESKEQKDKRKKQIEKQGIMAKKQAKNKIHKIDYQEKNGKYEDALTYAIRSGGFDTNRRRH